MHVNHIVFLVLFGYTSHVSGFINDPFVSTTLPTFSTATKRPTTTGSHQGPSNPGEIPPGIQDQLIKMQVELDKLSKENAALKLQVTSLENDVSTLVQLQGRVRQLEQESITTSREIAAIQSSGSITTRVEALEATQPQMKSDISRLKLQIGSSSRAFNSAMQNIQTSLDGVKQTVNKLLAAGGVVTENPGGQVPPHTSGSATLSPPSHTTPFTEILHGKISIVFYVIWGFYCRWQSSACGGVFFVSRHFLSWLCKDRKGFIFNIKVSILSKQSSFFGHRSASDSARDSKKQTIAD